MPAYVIFIKERVRDSAQIEIYSPKAGASIEGQPVKVLAAYGKTETLEGPPAEGVVLLEFPTMAEAKAWYNGPAYREARQYRYLGADYRAIMFESL